MPTEMEEYLFDLRGYLVLKEALNTDHIAALNTELEMYRALEPDQWCGNVHRAAGVGAHMHLHNVFEMGAAFEGLIDHPAWLDHMNRFIGGDGLFIDESFVDIRPDCIRGRISVVRGHNFVIIILNFVVARSIFYWP